MMKNKKRIIIKIGTHLLSKSLEGKLHHPLRSLIREIASLRKLGSEIVLVTSGAIGAGVQQLGLHSKPQEMRKKQATAAIGQVSLMRIYQNLFEREKLHVAQVLLTRSDFDDRKRYLNAQSTLSTLLEMGVIPIINENDTVAIEEIQFGDNDKLSALVAVKLDADLLIILSDVDGLFRSKSKGSRKIVSEVNHIAPDIESLAWKTSPTGVGTGGMASKIEAAKISTASGVTTFLANGFKKGVLSKIWSGKNVGTKFISTKSLSSKEKWILFGALPKGEVKIDKGAMRAIQEQKKSLLAIGVVEVKGHFKKGDVISIRSGDAFEMARGVVAYSSEELRRIKGKRSEQIKKLLQTKNKHSGEIIDRDSLVLIS